MCNFTITLSLSRTLAYPVLARAFTYHWTRDTNSFILRVGCITVPISVSYQELFYVSCTLALCLAPFCDHLVLHVDASACLESLVFYPNVWALTVESDVHSALHAPFSLRKLETPFAASFTMFPARG